MIIRQEETTPIGDYFHDNGINKIFENISNTVDEFEVDTDELDSYCDALINSIKGLRSQIKKVEAAWSKHKSQNKMNDKIHKGYDY